MTGPTASPIGTVTLLFSDIEGSTGLAQSLGSVWPAVLQQQRQVCRAAWSSHAGTEMGTEGDSFFVAFPSAEAGVAAAVSAQRALAEIRWTGDADVRIRIGVHTGSPLRHAEGYAGMDVHRAARVAAAAHGGQVLISEATAELVRNDLPADLGLIDLGEHRLKDIPHPLRLHQVTGPRLDRRFPPPRTLGGAGSLPPTLTPTVGRDDELDELEAILVRDRGRLVTLTGPGGTGKSRLAIALAERVAPAFADGVHFVPLMAVTTPTGMWSAIADVMDLPADDHAPPGFFDHVAQRRCLLVLDNLEQIPDADHVVRRLIVEATHLTVVATSRRPLHVDGEYDHAVPPLVLPTRDASYGEIESSAATQLFVDHARRAKRDFRLTADNAADIAALCRALDGLPLAIELAAARLRLMSCRAILARIDQALDLAHHDRSRPIRQQTLRHAIAWSYDLLDRPQQALLCSLAVFDGGASIDSLEQVARGTDDDAGIDLVDQLYALVDASLVRVSEADDGEPRFLLLQTVRRFALDESASRGELERAQLSHAQYYYDIAHARQQDSQSGDIEFKNLVLAELANLEAVIGRGPTGVRDPEHYGDLAVPTRHVTYLFCNLVLAVGRAQLAEQWAVLGSRTAVGPPDPVGAAALLQIRTTASYRLGNNDETVTLAEQVMAHLDQALNDSPTGPWLRADEIAARTVNPWVNALIDQGELERARQVTDDLEAALHDPTSLARDAQGSVGELRHNLAYASGDWALARDLLTAHVASMEAGGPLSPFQQVRYQNNLADVDMLLGDLPAAQRRLQSLTPVAADHADMNSVLLVAATFAAVVAAQHPLLCARVFGASATARLVEALPDTEWGVAEDERVMDIARAQVTPSEWTAAFEQGRSEQLPSLLTELAGLPPVSRTDASTV